MHAVNLVNLKKIHSINRNGLGYAEPLSNEQLQRFIPAIFADHAHESRSDRYVHVRTVDVLDGMRNAGFFPVRAQASATRDESNHGFQKHMIRFRREQDFGAEEAREVVIVNAHNGGTSFQESAGMFRQLCSNGLITGSADQDIRVRHSGKDVVGQVIEGAYTIINSFEPILADIDRMKSITLNDQESKILARTALAIRNPNQDLLTPEIIDWNARNALRPRRHGDTGSDLWTKFNVLQESMIRGQSAYTIDAKGRNRRINVREVKGIDQGNAINRALWKMAKEFAELKASS